MLAFINTEFPPGRFEPIPVGNCVPNDSSEKILMIPTSLIHWTHCAIYYVPGVFSSEPDRKKLLLAESIWSTAKKMKRDEFLTIFCSKFERHGSQWVVLWGSRIFWNSRENGKGNSKRTSHHMFSLYLWGHSY